MLRDYQKAAHDAAIGHLRKSLAPILIDAATGAGKSHIIAALAGSMHEISHGKRVLCLAPSAELVLQNAEKYEATGNPCSVFSASAGVKDASRAVIFGTPLSVKNGIDAFRDRLSTVVLDEAHNLTPTILRIIQELRNENEYLRVVGMTATPYRLGEGYIYREGPDGVSYGPELAKTPYFPRCVYRIHARDLIERGYLTPPVVGADMHGYDTSDLQINSMHRYTADSVGRAFEGKGRLTAQILGEVVRLAEGRQGVLVFAATVAHALECMDCLPADETVLITGETPRRERMLALQRFKARRIKYIVNVQVLTTGFDAPHVDLIAVLRATESAGLFQQIIGRGLRLCEGKEDCLILDYAGNVERHCPKGDVFDPEIAAHTERDRVYMEVTCPRCWHKNMFAQTKEGAKYDMDGHGYCVDLRGRRIPTENGHPLPGHAGRRCQHMAHDGTQCSYRWVWKSCWQCDHINDISARTCKRCGAELVDPNAKLSAMAARIDSGGVVTEQVIRVDVRETKSRAGNDLVIADFVTPTRQFRSFYHPASEWASTRDKCREFLKLYGDDALKTVTYRVNRETGIYSTRAFNKSV